MEMEAAIVEHFTIQETRKNKRQDCFYCTKLANIDMFGAITKEKSGATKNRLVQ